MRPDDQSSLLRLELKHKYDEWKTNQLRVAGIPRRFVDKPIDSYIGEHDGAEVAEGIATTFVDEFSTFPGQSLVFFGRTGTGKTHLAISIALELIRRGHTARYMTTANALQTVRAARRKGDELEALEGLESIELLILDEIGTPPITKAAKAILFEIIDRRYAALRSTIAVTSLPLESLRIQLGERAFDRLRDDGKLVPFTWETYRGQRW